VNAMTLYRPQAELAQPSTFEVMPLAIQLAEQLHMTDFVPKGLRGNKPAIMAAILAGHEVGLPPMASLGNIDVIDGRPRINAAAQRALILSRGHDLGFVEMTTTRCVMWGRRKGAQQTTEVSWTMDDAKRAGLVAKQNWTKHPSDMLVARATGKLARAIFADVIVGIPYNTEELADGELADGDNALPPSDGAADTGNGKHRRRAARPAVEPPPAPPLDPQPSTAAASPPAPPDPSQALAGAPPPDGSMPLNQQLAMACRELGIDRKVLIKALTEKERGSDLTREEAIGVLEAARAIQRGERRMEEREDGWVVVTVEHEVPDDAEERSLFDDDEGES